ncbi:MAG: Zn-ribbon domain-containing OB-fold protein [Chloroflexota bacterium]
MDETITNSLPQRPFTAASFNQYLAEGKLMSSSCSDCGSLSLPPRAICSNCHSLDLEWTESSGKGKLVGFTVVYIAPTFMIEQGYGREKPYVSGIVELEEGVKISARILGVDATNPESIRIGTSLEVEFIEAGEDNKKKSYLAFKIKQ